MAVNRDIWKYSYSKDLPLTVFYVYRCFSASYETRIFLIGGNDGNKKNNDLYSIVVLDSRYGEFSSLPDLEERVANFDIENKIEFIDSNKIND